MRRVTGLAVAALCTVTAGGLAPSAGAKPRVRSAQDVALLLRTHAVYSTPEARRKIAKVRAVRPITYARTGLPVIGRTTTADGRRWWRVRLPGRPNGSKGWISRTGTTLATTSWHIVVRISSRRALVYRGGRLVRSFPAIVGKGSTPTPRGEFFVEENVIMPRGKPGGPYALALSARSNVYQEFEGGPGQVGIHGVANLGGTLGTAASNGCIRLSNRSITWLAARIDPGVPVTIAR